MTIANVITLLRFFLVPAVVFALLTGEFGWAFAGFLAAGVSDAVDGFLARHFDQHTELGAYLDPIADKLLLVSVFIVLGYMEELPLWLVIAVVSRDALIVGGVVLATIMGHPVAMRPLMVSKANTLMQILLALLVLAELAFDYNSGQMRLLPIALTGLLTVASGAAYLVDWIRHMSGYAESDTTEH